MRANHFLAGTASVILALSLLGCQVTQSDDSESTVASPSESVSATPSPDSTDDTESNEESDASGSGESSSGNQDSSGSTDSPGAPAASATPSAAPAPPAPSGPTVALINQRCSSGKLLITLTANADNSYRKGISSALLERQNEYDAWLDSDADWLGPETGQGNQWTGNLPGNTQNIGKTLRVTVKGTTGTTTLTAPITVPC